MKNIIINNQSNKPIYQQLYDQISSQILKKQITANTQLPSIRKTSKELRVSIITIKKTWEMLEQNNYIYTVAGKGSYVAESSDNVLDEKKHGVIEELLVEVIENSKSLGLSKEALIALVEKKYN